MCLQATVVHLQAQERGYKRCNKNFNHLMSVLKSVNIAHLKVLIELPCAHKKTLILINKSIYTYEYSHFQLLHCFSFVIIFTLVAQNLLGVGAIHGILGK